MVEDRYHKHKNKSDRMSGAKIVDILFFSF